MITHWDDVPWTAREHGELRFGRRRPAHARGAAGAAFVDEPPSDELSGAPRPPPSTREPADPWWHPDARRISFRGLGVVARVEPLEDRDGEG